MKNFTDQEIIEAIYNGKDEEVVKSLYESVLPNVRRYICSNSGSPEDAFDLFQDALLVFYKLVATNKFDPEKYKIHGFILTVSKNLWINQMKKKARSLDWKKRKETDDLDETVLETLITEERKMVLDKVFQSLGDKCVEILTLFFYNRLSLKEIAIKLNYPSEEAVKVKSHRCRKLLSEKVKGDKYLFEQLQH